MLCALCLTMTLTILPAAAPPGYASPGLGDNAALKYWQAFLQLPKFADDEQKKLVADCLTMPLDALRPRLRCQSGVCITHDAPRRGTA